MLRVYVYKSVVAIAWGAALLLGACSEHGIGNHPPVIPYNPNPADGATQVSRNANLYWRCDDPDGDPLTFDVYFGTNSSPPLAQENLTEKVFTPGTMEANTKYYWRVTAKDNQGGESTSAVWSFTTGTSTNKPPNPPANPSPKDGATNVSVNVTLSWTCTDPESDPLTFDIHFGEDPNNLPLRAQKHTTKSWSPGTLKENTTYYWQIVAYDDSSFYVVTEVVVASGGGGKPSAAAPAGNAARAPAVKTKPTTRTATVQGGTPGPVWRFTTAGGGNQPPNPPSNPNPSNGAENVDVNANLSWTCSDPDNDPLTFDIYFGTSSPPPLAKSNHGTKSYDPGTMQYITKYYWKIVAKDNHNHQTPGPEWSFTTQGHGGFLWHADWDKDTILKIRIDTGSVVSSFPSPGPFPRGLAFDGSYLWNADESRQRIYKLNPNTGSILSSWPSPGTFPMGLAYDGAYLWNADSFEDKIYKLVPSTGSVVASINAPGGIWPWGLTYDGVYLWNADNYAHRVYKMVPSNGSIVGSFGAPESYPRGLAYGGTYLWNVAGGTIYKLSPSSGSVISSFPSPASYPAGLGYQSGSR